MTLPLPASDLARATPMIAQYIEIKNANPGSLLFYRMGDFYELFFEDAEVASRALGIVLTKRGKHEGADIRMCGVPIDRADDYLQRLIGLGHRVAVCEQMEDPAEARKRGAKSVVKRAVTRLVTPGTITEERLLDPARASVMLALARLRQPDGSWRYGLAAVDISTGSFSLSSADSAGLGAQVARIEPREIVLPDAMREDRAAMDALGTACPVTPVAQESGAAAAELRLREWYGVAALEGFGQFSPVELAAAGAALAYIETTQRGARPLLGPPRRAQDSGVMEIDAATRANLELTRTISGAREGSLLHNIDLCVTPAGSRLLAERLAEPLIDPARIGARLDCAAFFLAQRELRASLRGQLKTLPDMVRSLARLALERGGPRDLAALRGGLAAGRAIAASFGGAADLPPLLEDARASLAALPPALEAALAAALAEDPPHKAGDGGFVRAGHVPALDEARALRDESRRVIAALQGTYAEAAQTRQLRIKHNHFLGYFIEVPQAQGETLLRPPFAQTFIHRQTMADAMRFSTAELAGLDARIGSAAGEALAIELAVFKELCGGALAAAAGIRAASDALAQIDVAAALAELAGARGWTRPLVDSGFGLDIDAGRHPVVEAALKARGEGFVSNGCRLTGPDGGNGLVAIVTGPNMAGKSTFLRQTALIAVLAQAGSYVPARRAHIGAVDRLFSRVGAADDLARGRSTFMVEMVETAAILNQATPQSLVILDEIGRGTATYDGLSIAWAAVEHLHNVNRSRALFATHFHELTRLPQTLTRLVNLTMRVSSHKGDVVFLHEVIAGAADRSYGIQVAKLAGLPPAVVQRARKLLGELEAAARQGGMMVEDLPLFSAAKGGEAEDLRDLSGLREALDAIDPDTLTPRAALDALYRLKRAHGSST